MMSFFGLKVRRCRVVMKNFVSLRQIKKDNHDTANYRRTV